MDKRDVRQLFGEPIEEVEYFWKYQGFGIGFQEQYVGNINFYFGEGVDWRTEEGISKGMTKHQVIEVYGIPKQAAVEGSVFYYDSFNISFDEAGLIQRIVIIIRKVEGVTLSEVEDMILDEMEDNPEAKQDTLQFLRAVDKAFKKKGIQTGYKESRSTNK